MLVTVLHGQTNRDTFEVEDHQPIAKFEFSDEEVGSIDDALEMAYLHTQNLRDSWSQAGSQDAHPSLRLVQPREVYNGREMGHRSSMVGDQIAIAVVGEDYLYKVAGFGFERIL